MCLPAARLRFADLLGITLSLTCLVHCLALPLLILLAPALGRRVAAPEWMHAAILLLALPAAMAAMLAGWRRHTQIVPAVLALTGLGLLQRVWPSMRDGSSPPTARSPTGRSRRSARSS